MPELAEQHVPDFFRLMGDMDGNGQVTIADFSTMVGTFLRATTDPAYLGADDLDGDGTVGIADINLLVGNFLHSVRGRCHVDERRSSQARIRECFRELHANRWDSLRSAHSTSSSIPNVVRT